MNPATRCVGSNEQFLTRLGIYIAYAWLATIVWAFTDAVQAIWKGPQLHPQPSVPSRLDRMSYFHKGGRMSSEGYEQMLILLKELSVYKALMELRSRRQG